MKARSGSSSNAPVLPLTFSLQRSHSPTRNFSSPSSSSASDFAVHRTLSPTPASFSGGFSYSSTPSAMASSSIHFVLDISASQVQPAARPISLNGGATMNHIPPPRKTCMCSLTIHPGSFRCSLHRNTNNSPSSTTHSQLNARRSAVTNSLVRIEGVEGEWVRRALAALMRPSSHHMRRRTSFQPRPSRLCRMTTAQDVS